jgi:hypothetical protein
VLEQALADPVRPPAAHHEHDIARPHLAREPRRGRLDAAGCGARDPRRPRRDRRREPCRRRDRRVRVAARPDVRDGGRVGGREHVRERVEQGRRPVVGQRLVDCPDPPTGLALADGGEGLPDRGGMVSVVVVDDDPGGLALALQPSPDTSEARQPRRDGRGRRTDRHRGGRHPERVCRIVAPRGRQPDPDRPGKRVETRDLERRPGRVGPDDPAEERGRRPGERPEPAGDPARVPRDPLGSHVHQRRRDHPTRPVGKPGDERGDPVVGDVRHQHGRAALRSCAGAAEPRLERRDHGLPIGEHVRMVPLRGGDDGDRRPVRIEVAGVLVRLDDERPTIAAAGRRRHVEPGLRGREQRTDERARVEACAREHVNQPARGR